MDNSGKIQLHRVVQSDHNLSELVEFLAAGGDPNQTIIDNYTLLHIAARSYKANYRIVDKLIKAGADLELTTSLGRTPLQLAAISRNRDAVRALIEAGVQINVRDCLGRTALHYAVYTYHYRVLPKRLSWLQILRDAPDEWILKWLLVDGDADANPMDSKGETPLMWAVKYRKEHAVSILLKRGANPNITNKLDQNSLHIALHAVNPHIVSELMVNGAGIYDVDKFGLTPLDLLIDIIKYYINAEFEVAARTLMLIAFKYEIREDLAFKTRWNSKFSEILSESRQEIDWMNKHIIYDNLTLHDFASGCVQEGIVEDPLTDIYIPVVQILLSEKYTKYFLHILLAMSKRDLIEVLKTMLPPADRFYSPLIDAVSPFKSYLDIFGLIKDYYEDLKAEM